MGAFHAHHCVEASPGKPTVRLVGSTLRARRARAGERMGSEGKSLGSREASPTVKPGPGGRLALDLSSSLARTRDPGGRRCSDVSCAPWVCTRGCSGPTSRPAAGSPSTTPAVDAARIGSTSRPRTTARLLSVCGGSDYSIVHVRGARSSRWAAGEWEHPAGQPMCTPAARLLELRYRPWRSWRRSPLGSRPERSRALRPEVRRAQVSPRSGLGRS